MKKRSISGLSSEIEGVIKTRLNFNTDKKDLTLFILFKILKELEKQTVLLESIYASGGR